MAAKDCADPVSIPPIAPQYWQGPYRSVAPNMPVVLWPPENVLPTYKQLSSNDEWKLVDKYPSSLASQLQASFYTDFQRSWIRRSPHCRKLSPHPCSLCLPPLPISLPCSIPAASLGHLPGRFCTLKSLSQALLLEQLNLRQWLYNLSSKPGHFGEWKGSWLITTLEQ